MIRRGTWIVLAIFVLLVGLAFYLNQNPLPSSAQLTPSATEVPVLLSGWKDNDIVYIDYKGDPGPVTLSQNPEGGWIVGPDGPTPAAVAQVEYLRTQLAALRVNSVLNTTDPLDAVGLVAPTRTITLRNAQGSQVVIRVGKETPTGSGYYLQLDNQAPVVVNKLSLDGVLNALTRETLAAPSPTAETSPFLSETAQPVVTSTP